MKRRDFLRTAAGAGGVLIAQPWLSCLRAATGKARDFNLRVTDIKTFIVSTGNSNFLFCKVYTNQGLTGLGEGSVTSKESTVSAAILEHNRYLVGKDPTDIELHWQAMYRNPRWRGGPILNSAISAIEIALWDILGQALGQPIYKLLGGKARERVRLYKDVASNVDAFLAAKQEGFTAAKATCIRVDNSIVVPHYTVNEGVKLVEAVRRAVGDNFDICIDVKGEVTPTMALEFCTRVEPFRPMFVEEASQLEDLGELAMLRQKTKVPLATGECSFTKYGFTEFCSRHLVDYIQPDVCHAGGILEMKKIGAIAEAFRVEMAPHNPQSEVSTMASLHIDATTPSSTIQELNPTTDFPWLADLFQGGGVRYKNGYAELPDRPGLGVSLDEKVAAAHPYQPVTRPQFKFADGSVADL